MRKLFYRYIVHIWIKGHLSSFIGVQFGANVWKNLSNIHNDDRFVSIQIIIMYKWVVRIYACIFSLIQFWYFQWKNTTFHSIRVYKKFCDQCLMLNPNTYHNVDIFCRAGAKRLKVSPILLNIMSIQWVFTFRIKC